MASIDNLTIDISASASSASRNIDKLIDRFSSLQSTLSSLNSGGLGNLASNLSRFSTAMSQVGSIDSRKFSTLSDNINKLSSVNASGLSSVATSLNEMTASMGTLSSSGDSITKIAELSDAIGKLGLSKVSKAIDNIPRLATAMKDLLKTLSKAPAVNQSIIDMTFALANLASHGSSVGSAGKGLAITLKAVGNSAKYASGKSNGLAAIFGKLYANFFWVKRMFDSAWKSIESSMDYIEVLNYFDKAFEQVSNKADLSAWEDLGYKSAETYGKSFEKRAKEVTSQMTGFTVNDNGTLTSSGGISLGMNPSEVMNYQAMFGQISSSMGVASESALRMSEVMTKLGADLASVKNMNFSDVWNNLSSGLVGMSRSVDKFGVNIRNVNLQQKLTELGIQANIQALNQQDKALLRSIIILDSTRYAWADLSETLNQPANQLRLLQSNFSNLSRIMGNLFLPIVSKVLPYINALVIALQRLFTWLGSLLGLDLSGLGGGSSKGIDDLIGSVDDLNDGLGSAVGNAEKLKKQLRGWDEINNLTTSDSSGKGVGAGGLPELDQAFLKLSEEYLSAWNAAYAQIEDRARGIANNIEKTFALLKTIIRDVLDGDWFKAGQDTSKLVVGLFNWFSNAIDNVNWFALGQKIGKFLAGIEWIKIFASLSNVVVQALKALLQVLLGAFSKAPIETTIITLANLPKILKAITASKIVTGITKLTKGFVSFGDSAIIASKALLGNSNAANALATFYPDLNVKITKLSDLFKNGLPSALTTFRNNLTVVQKSMIGLAVAGTEFVVLKSAFYDIAKGSDNLGASLAKIGVVASAASVALYVAFGPAGLAIAGVTALVAGIVGVDKALKEIRAEEIGASIKNAFDNPDGTPLSDIVANFQQSMSSIGDSFSLISEGSNQLESANSNIESTWREISKIEAEMNAGVISVEEGSTKLSEQFKTLAEQAETQFDALENTLLVAFGEGGVLNEVFDRLGISTANTTNTLLQLNDKVEARIKEITELMSTVDPKSEAYAQYREELARLTSQTGEFASAISEYQYELNNINLSELFDENGKLNTEKAKEILELLSKAAEDTNEKLDTAMKGIYTSLQEEYNKAIAIGNQQSADEIKAKMDALPDALALLKQDVATKAAEVTDEIQLQMVQKMPQIIEQSNQDFEKKNFAEKFWHGVWGKGSTASGYAKEATDTYNKEMSDFSGLVETTFSKLGIDGAGWAGAAGKKISEQMFEDLQIPGQQAVVLKSNYETIFNNATKGLPDLAKSRGKDATDGYSNAFTDNANVKNGTKSVKSFVDNMLDTIANAQDSHSPSKKTKQLGKDAVDGYNLGFSTNISTTMSVISDFVNSALNTLSDQNGRFNDIGVQSMQGLLNGMSSMEYSLYQKADEIANNIAQKIRSALQIHSPSRVMMELGEYTMEGFRNGMESLYNPILKSVDAFSNDLVVNPMPTLDTSYDNGRMAMATSYSNSSVSDYFASNSADNSETNSLLRELVSAVREGKTIQINGREIGQEIRNQDRAYYKQTGKGMFEH